MKKCIAEFEMECEILKSYHHISKKTLDRIVAFIKKYKEKYTIKLICKALEFSKSTYYKVLIGIPSNH